MSLSSSPSAPISMPMETTATPPSPLPTPPVAPTPSPPSSTPTNLATLLPTAIADNPCLISALLTIGKDPDTRGDDRCSALILANAFGSTNTIVTLLDASAWVNPATLNLSFHVTAASDCANLISLLVGSYPYRAWAGATTPNNRMPVHVALVAGNIDVVRHYVTSGGNDPDRADSCRWIPLHYTTTDGYLDVAEFLIGRST